MRALIQAAVFLSASANSLALPPTVHHHKSNIAVAGPTAANTTTIFFSVPCHKCFPDIEEELDFELRLESSNASCQPSAIFINDRPLSSVQPASDVHTLVLKANTVGRPSVQEVTASWEMSCINDEVMLLSLQIKDVFGLPQPKESSGFAASFKQKNTPSLLNLEFAPLDDISNVSDRDTWTQIHPNLDVVTVTTSTMIDEDLPNELQFEMRRLHEIKAQISRLHEKYVRQEHRIFDMIKEDFTICDGPTCIFQTAVKKAPDFFDLVKAHFKHRPDWTKIRGNNAYKQRQGVFRFGEPPMMPGGPITDLHFSDPSPAGDHNPDHTPYPTPFDKQPSEEDKRPPPPPPFIPGDDLPPPPWMHDGPPPPWDDDFPPPPPPPSGHHEHPPPFGHHHEHPPPPPGHHRNHGEDSVSVSTHDGHHPRPGRHGPGHHRSHFLGRYGPHHHPFFFSVGSMIFFVVLASLLFKCVRAKTGLFRNSWRQRDRAARREECRNRAAYRRAAFRHRWQRWWSQFRQPEGTADYEEKRARILSQEDALEDVMESEIRDIRRAHEMVGDMMRAEDRRQRMYHEANFGTSSQSSTPPYDLHQQHTGNDQSSTSFYPPYTPPPPSYDQELEGEMMVVDGFSYTPSASENTPESSIVDCNSRMSFDTSTTITK